VKYVRCLKYLRLWFVFFAYTTTTFAASSAIESKERLSQWLFHHDQANPYPIGLAWFVPNEKPAQQALKQQLLTQLSQCLSNPKSRCHKAQLAGLIAQLNQFPVTGRVPVAMAEPLWLELHPIDDPILNLGQSVELPIRPKSVTVFMENGELCQVPFIPRATADVYIKQCVSSEKKVDYAWVAQPDGSIARYGIAIWNEEAQNPPAPGAWIWAPGRWSGIQSAVSDDLIHFLASQGAAPDPLAFELETPRMVLSKKRNAEFTANDWGMIGLLQMPSARMEKSSEVRLTVSNTYPFRIGTVIFQPFEALEAGFHYARIATEFYDPSHRISDLALYDKGFDVKLRVLKESAYLPQLAIGGQDVAGTGRFSGEYIVASKRTRSFDWTLGVAWGNLGARSNISNPFGANFYDRNGRTTGMGGQFNYHSYFHGSSSVFGGVQWQTPWDPLLVKLEYDPSYYPIGQTDVYTAQKSPINIGMVYRLFPSLDLSAGYERGNALMLGVTLHTALNDLRQPKVFDPPPIPIQREISSTPPNWSHLATDINAMTGWSVVSIAIDGSAMRLEIDGAASSYGGSRLNALIAILHREAPETIKRFVLTFVEYGMRLDAKDINRALWVTEHTEALPPSLQLPSMLGYSPPYMTKTPATNVWQSNYRRFSGVIAPIFSQSMGGPDSFFLYQAGVYGSGELKLNQSTSLTGTIALRVLDNYKHFVYDGLSYLPHVRTDIRRYVETSWNTIPNLQLTHTKQLSSNQFVSIYGGLLEMMFAGVGAEWLYRPWHSAVALGIDANYVQQRGFAQHFNLQEYRVGTGQLKLYWDTGWNGVLTQLSAGQYLAGDRGVGIDISRRFDNGVIVGAYATKTNVSAIEFGEGSFNKGVYISVPFDTVMPISTPGSAYMNWQPLLRDGGAELNRPITLYALTSERDKEADHFDR
jgi:hypothetical protein